MGRGSAVGKRHRSTKGTRTGRGRKIGAVAAGLAVVSGSAALLTGSGVAGANPAATSLIYACYSNSTGEMFRVTSTQTCPAGETKISWNQAGPQGAKGAQGAQGAKGAQGAAGAQGGSGPQGAVGAKGAQGAAGAQGRLAPRAP